MKQFNVNDEAWASDYEEPVRIIKVEREMSEEDEFAGTYTIERPNYETTSNYPGYLLREVNA